MNQTIGGGPSPFTLDFIKQLEGYTPQPKWDYKQNSVGYGTRWNPGDPIGTRADHEAALSREAGKVSQWLDQNVTTPLQPNQRAALTSAGFNLGTGEKGLARLLGDINAGNWDSVARRLPTFNKAGGEVNKGLINRRAAEVEMLTGRKPSAYIGGKPEVEAGTGYISGTGATPTGGPMPAQMPPQALVQPSGRYSKLADMLLASGAGAKPKGWGELLNAGGDLALGYSLSNKDEQAQNQYRSKLAEALGGAGDRDALVNTLMQSGDPDLMKTAISEKLKPPAAPQTGRFKAEENGGVLDTATGEWVVPPPSAGDTGGLSPIAEKEKQKALGKAQGEAAANLPTALNNTRATIDAVDELLADPGLSRVTGPLGGTILPDLSPAARRAKSRLDQLTGKTFLQAFETLKGGGQITETEGKKATDALNRLSQTGMSDDDYRQAVIDFRNEVAKLYDIAQERAGVPADQRQVIPPLEGQQTQQQQPKSEPPAPAVQFLQQNPSPEIIEQFNQKYGPGAAERILSNQPSMTGVAP